MVGSEKPGALPSIENEARPQPVPEAASASGTLGQMQPQYADVLELVRMNNPRAENFLVGSIRKGVVDGGDIFVVLFDKDGGNYMNYAIKVKDNMELYRNDNLLVDGILRYANRPRLVSQLFTTQVITGIIALILVSSIVYLLVVSPEGFRIPEVLSSGLALILGFYFGRSSNSYTDLTMD